MSDSATEERSAPTREYLAVREVSPPEPPPPSDGPPGSTGLWSALSRPLASAGARLPVLGALAALVLIVVLAVTGAFSGLFTGARKSLGPPPGIVMVGSSWVTGEPSLAASPYFVSIESSAVSLAQLRWAAHEQLIAAIAAAKRALAARRRADQLKKYEELRAKELAAYHAKLREIEKLRAEQLAKERAAKLAYEKALAKYLRERRVTPGKECQDPLVRQYYNCQNGLLPAGHSKGH